MGTGKNCKLTKLHEGTKLHEDKFAPRVNFAQVTILHGGSFLHESKKKTEKKTYIKKKRKSY